MARDRFNESDMHDVRIRLIRSRNSDSKQYNFPNTIEVAAIIVGDLNIENCERDIIVLKPKFRIATYIWKSFELYGFTISIAFPLWWGWV